MCCLGCRVPEDMQGTATFLAKADGVLAGLAVADLVSITAFSSHHVLAMQAACASAVGRVVHAIGCSWPVAAGHGPHTELSPLWGGSLGSFPHSYGSLAAAAITAQLRQSVAEDSQPAASQPRALAQLEV